MKRIFLIVAFIFCVIFVVGCNISSENSSKKVPEANTTYSVQDYTDPETGVHYLIYTAGYQGGITVRYNADGTIMVDSAIREKK